MISYLWCNCLVAVLALLPHHVGNLSFDLLSVTIVWIMWIVNSRRWKTWTMTIHSIWEGMTYLDHNSISLTDWKWLVVAEATKLAKQLSIIFHRFFQIDLSSHFVESEEGLALSALYSNHQQKHFMCFIISSSKRLFHTKNRSALNQTRETDFTIGFA
jgi:hypothetical protein